MLASLAAHAVGCTPSEPASLCVVVEGVTVEPTTVCGPRGRKAVVEGDIFVTIPSTREEAKRAHAIAPWRGNEVPFVLEGELEHNAPFARSFAEAVKDGATYGVKLRPRRDDDTDYLLITTRAPRGSHLGRVGGPQELATDGVISGAALSHLMEHAVGLLHEPPPSVTATGGRFARVPLPPDRAGRRGTLQWLTDAEALMPVERPLISRFHGIDVQPDAQTIRPYCLRTLPADLVRACRGPAPAVEFCSTLCSGHPNAGAMARVALRAAARLNDKLLTVEELDNALKRFEFLVTWEEQQRVIALHGKVPMRLAVPPEVLAAAGACPIFEVGYYQAANPDLAAAGIRGDEDARRHWLERGIWEGRPSSPVFHLEHYWNHSGKPLASTFASMLSAVTEFVATHSTDPTEWQKLMDRCAGKETP